MLTSANSAPNRVTLALTDLYGRRGNFEKSGLRFSR